MLLDSGICTVYEAENSAAAGEKPVNELTEKYQSWYAELNVSTDAVAETEYREDVEANARIRIFQNRAVTNRDIVTLVDELRYEIIRAYHGTDNESGEQISDLTLRRIN